MKLFKKLNTLWLARSALIAAYLLLCVGVTISIIEQKAMIKDNAIKNMREKANLIKKEEESTFIRMYMVLEYIAKEYTPIMTGQTKMDTKSANESLYALIKKMPETLPFSLIIMDANGSAVYNSSPDASVINLNFKDRAYFQALKNNPNSDIVISNPIISRLSHVWVITLSKRMSYPDGRFAGNVTIAINLDYFNKIFANLELDEKGMVSIYNMDFYNIGRYPAVNGLYGKNINLTEIKELFAKGIYSGYYDRESRIDGVFRNLYFCKVPDFPIFILIGISPDDYLKEWKQDVIIDMLYMLLVAFMFIVLERILTKREREKELFIQQSRLASMGEMIANIAHQWRQPLNEISAFKDSIVEDYYFKDLNDEKIENFSLSINNCLRYMSNTIDDFRNFFKPDREKIKFNINNVIKSSLSLISNTMASNNVVIKIELYDEDIVVDGFQNEFMQVLLNIINNSKDALISNNAVDNRFITIKTIKDEQCAKIAIQDNAGGIPSVIMNKIFEPYFTTKFAAKGTGLGLYMSKMIIEDGMDGKIFVSNIANGVCFTIELPIVS